MGTERFEKRTRLPHSADAVYRWHMRPGAFERLTPPWESVSVVEQPAGGIAEGARVTLLNRVGPLALPWVALHEAFVEGRQFRDVQEKGPFAAWRHTHRFEPSPDGGSELVDDIEYRLPLGPLGQLFGGAFVRSKLERMFRYRHAVTIRDLRAHARTEESPTMKILMGGASGLVGRAAAAFLTTGGHEVVRLVRPKSDAADGPTARWDPKAGEIEPGALDGIDAVIHLSGENLAAGRWTDARKRRILDSRVVTTRLLAEAMARQAQPPKVWVCASAVGYYGDNGDQVLTEASRKGEGFLADVCEAWEESTRPAVDAGVRVVHARFGVILSPDGGALGKMLPIFKVGGGGPLGGGEQYMSWIALDDVVGALHHALLTEGLEGAVNVTAPNPVPNQTFAETLGKVLGRPAVVPAPAFALRLALGKEMAEETLLASTRAYPKKLEDTGYAFRHPDLEGALRHVLGKT